MAELLTDLPPLVEGEVFDPSPLRHPYLTPQSDWTRDGLERYRQMQRNHFLSFSTFKITSLGPKGQAELLRMLFHYAKIPYEDEFLKDIDWKSLICKTPHGNLPVLWLDHKCYGEMNTIVRLLGRHLVMMGTDEMELLLVETILQQVQTLRESDVLQKAFEEFHERPIDNYEQLFEVMLPELFSGWENELSKHEETHFFLPSGICLADLAVYDLIDQHARYLPLWDVLHRYPMIQRLYTAVRQHPSMFSYFGSSFTSPVRLYE